MGKQILKVTEINANTYTAYIRRNTHKQLQQHRSMETYKRPNLYTPANLQVYIQVIGFVHVSCRL